MNGLDYRERTTLVLAHHFAADTFEEIEQPVETFGPLQQRQANYVLPVALIGRVGDASIVPATARHHNQPG